MLSSRIFFKRLSGERLRFLDTRAVVVVVGSFVLLVRLREVERFRLRERDRERRLRSSLVR